MFHCHPMSLNRKVENKRNDESNGAIFLGRRARFPITPHTRDLAAEQVTHGRNVGRRPRRFKASVKRQPRGNTHKMDIYIHKERETCVLLRKVIRVIHHVLCCDPPAWNSRILAAYCHSNLIYDNARINVEARGFCLHFATRSQCSNSKISSLKI